jgi:hypothetical protein
LQNLASVSDELRRDIAEAGGVRPTVKMLRRPDIPPVVAHAACSVLQNLAMLPANEEVLVEAGSIEVLLQQCSKYTKVKDYVAGQQCSHAIVTARGSNNALLKRSSIAQLATNASSKQPPSPS